MLAGLMGWSQATFASKVEVDESRGVVTVTREVDGGMQKIECKLPAIITTDLRLNGTSVHGGVSVSLTLFPEPRYTSLPNIMKAKKKPIEKMSAEELGVDLKPRLETVKVTEPPKRKGGAKVCEKLRLVV